VSLPILTTGTRLRRSSRGNGRFDYQFLLLAEAGPAR
jgi:hypothetical protein